MDLEDARCLLLAASLEEADPDGVVISSNLRRAASDSAPDPGAAVEGDGEQFTAAEERFLVARAEALVEGAEAAQPAIWQATQASAMLRFAGWGLLVVCLLVGYLSKHLGPSGVVSIIAFPLLGLMVWNLVIYLLLGVKKLVAGRGVGLMLKVVEWWRNRRQAGGFGGMSKFTERWWSVSSPVYARRLSVWLHLGAAAIAVGAVCAMYWQGLVREYHATWESTFLSAESVRGILSVALAPATWMPGLELPDVAGIEALRSPGEERAAAWIHRYALAAGVVIVLPRVVLALLASVGAKAAGRGLDVRSVAPGYFRSLLDEKRGLKSVARVVPHRIELDSRRRDQLRSAFHAQWGGVLWIEFLPAVAYGDEEDFADRVAELEGSDYVAVVAGFGSTPEEESQGRLLREVARTGEGGGSPLLCLDASGFRERFGDGRFDERRATWEKLAQGCGFDLLVDEGS